MDPLQPPPQIDPTEVYCWNNLFEDESSTPLTVRILLKGDSLICQIFQENCPTITKNLGQITVPDLKAYFAQFEPICPKNNEGRSLDFVLPIFFPENGIRYLECRHNTAFWLQNGTFWQHFDPVTQKRTFYPCDQTFLNSECKEAGKKIINLPKEQLRLYCTVAPIGPEPFSRLAQKICLPFAMSTGWNNLKECQLAIKKNGEILMRFKSYGKMPEIAQKNPYKAIIYSEDPWKIVFFEKNDQMLAHSLFKKVVQHAVVSIGQSIVSVHLQPIQKSAHPAMDVTIQACIETNDVGFQVHFAEKIPLPVSAPVSCLQITPKTKISQMDNRSSISHFHWGVTLIRRGGSQNEHAQIVIEGLVMTNYFNQRGLRPPFKIITESGELHNLPKTHSVNRPEYFKENSLFKSMCHFPRPNVIEIIHFEENDEVDYVERSQVYLITRDQAMSMLKAISEEQVNPPTDQRKWGENSLIPGTKAMSCIDWCKKKMAVAGIKLDPFLGQALATPTSWYTPFTNPKH